MSEQKKLTKEQQIQYVLDFRESNLQILNSGINKLIKTILEPFKELPHNDENDFKRYVAMEVYKQLEPVSVLMATLRVIGAAKSLIFIGENGIAIDLLKVKDIESNEIFNQVLDNMPIKEK